MDDVAFAALPTSSGSRTKKSSASPSSDLVPNAQERAHPLGGLFHPGRIGHAQDDLFHGWPIEESPRRRGVRHDDPVVPVVAAGVRAHFDEETLHDVRIVVDPHGLA